MKRTQISDDDAMDICMEAVRRMRVSNTNQDDDAHDQQCLWDGAMPPGEGAIVWWSGVKFLYSTRLSLWWSVNPRHYWSADLGWGYW